MMKGTPNSIYAIVSILNRINGAGSTQVKLFESEVDSQLGRIKKIEKTRTDRQIEIAQNHRSEKTWESISGRVQDCLSLTALAGGVYALKEQGADTAALLAVAAGVTTIANRALKATGAYDAMKGTASPEETVASYLEAGMGWASAGLSLAAGCAQGGIQTAVNIFSGIVDKALNVYQGSVDQKNAENSALSLLDTVDIRLSYQDIFKSGEMGLRIIQSQEKIASIAARCVENQKIED